MSLTWFPEDTAELHDELRDHPAWTTAALKSIAGEGHAQIARAQKPEKTKSARRSRPPGHGPAGPRSRRLPSRRA